MTQLRIALLQMDIALGQPEVNQAKAREWVEKAAAAGTDLIVLPEMWNTGYSLQNIKEVADRNGEQTRAMMSELARTYNVNIHAGSVSDLRDGQVYNTTYLFDRKGQVTGTYSKVHLFRLMDEEKYLQGGDRLGEFTVDGVQIGSMICYDLRFPELSRTMVLNGAQALFVPAEWPHPRLNHWRHLQIARAIENQTFVISCNRVGFGGETEFFGHSMVIDPWGEILLEADETEGIHHVTIDLSVVPEIRSRIPIFEDRRPELYK
ncbi:carbon-nitrogen family hydrolase [Tumebacillus sp. DT12]|uniref:Carbon-nitrogen family hydrolase n=1 Tax=Tumebacillus lacus TaxID=2995335 RepID=A0ABT3X4C0_9BACL|nr:carbon-nitrogen family hydrolase [Tumebacillus lacus]MCX7571743.1 carbon-nitrogen family hydrolase [Tumebacillus lacus]